MKRLLLYGTLTASWLLGAACRKPPTPEVVAAVQAEQEPEQESWQVDYRLSLESKPRLRLLAAHLIRQELPESTYVVLEGRVHEPVRGWIFSPEGDSAVVFQAQRIVYYENARRFELEGAVEMVTREKRRLLTEQLHWLEDRQRLYAPGYVRVLGLNEHVEGFQLDADERLTTYRLRRVTGRVVIEDEAFE